MKKLIALLIVCGFAFAFVACGGGAKQEAESTEEPATEETVAPLEEEEVPADSVEEAESDSSAVVE